MAIEDKAADIETAERRRSELGRWASVVYVAILIIYVIFQWDQWNKLPPNEVGDFLAGAFGPLAFLWLVLGYAQQGAELRQNTIAIKQQAAELAHAVEEYKNLVDITRRQHEADISHRKAQLELEHSRQQPSFELSAVFRTIGGTQLVFEVEVANGAVACSQIEIRSWKGDDSDHEKSQPFLAGGGSFKFPLYLNREPRWRPERISISFRDGNGKMQQLWYMLDMFDAGTSDWQLFFIDEMESSEVSQDGPV